MSDALSSLREDDRDFKILNKWISNLNVEECLKLINPDNTDYFYESEFYKQNKVFADYSLRHSLIAKVLKNSKELQDKLKELSDVCDLLDKIELEIKHIKNKTLGYEYY